MSPLLTQTNNQYRPYAKRRTLVNLLIQFDSKQRQERFINRGTGMIFIQVNKLLPVLKVPSNHKVSGNGKKFSVLVSEFTNQDKVTFFSGRASLNFSTVCFPSISYYRETQQIFLLSA